MTQTPVQSLSWPDEALDYAALPASGDDGFPQVFRVELGSIVYRLSFGVSFTDPALVLGSQYAGMFFDLPDPEHGLFLTLRVDRDDLPPGSGFVGARRVVLAIPIALGPLRFRFSRIKIAQANLAGPGQFGSELTGEVAVTDV
jgi:hypothetical protein